MSPERSPTFWLTPVANRPGLSATDCLRAWLDHGYWGVFRTNQMGTKIAARDWIAFYGAGRGVLAYGQATAAPTKLVTAAEWPEPTAPRSDVYRLPVQSVTWLTVPIAVPSVLDQLELMRGRAPRTLLWWQWLVNATRAIPEADFQVLTNATSVGTR